MPLHSKECQTGPVVLHYVQFLIQVFKNENTIQKKGLAIFFVYDDENFIVIYIFINKKKQKII